MPNDFPGMMNARRRVSNRRQIRRYGRARADQQRSRQQWEFESMQFEHPGDCEERMLPHKPDRDADRRYKTARAAAVEFGYLSVYLRTPTISWPSFFDISDRNDFENEGKMMGVLNNPQ